MSEANEQPVVSKGGRLESLDVLRGFDMFFIFLPDPAPCVVFVFLAMIGLGDTAFAAQFDHVRWSGLHQSPNPPITQSPTPPISPVQARPPQPAGRLRPPDPPGGNPTP